MTESEVADECERFFDEDQELEQLINGQICFKVYPFSSGMVQPLVNSNNNLTLFFILFLSISLSIIYGMEIALLRQIRQMMIGR